MILRYWQSSDLPWIQGRAAETAWSYLSDEERQGTTPALAAAGAARGVRELSRSSAGFGLVAELEGRPAGYILITLVPHPYTQQLEAHFIDLFVEPRFRRRGVGRRLTQAAEAEVARWGIQAIKLFIQGDNQPSRAHAQSLGYRVTGEVWAKGARQQQARASRPVIGGYYG